MASPRSDWDATFIPGSHVLANKLGIDDPDQLEQLEYGLTATAERQVLRGQLVIDRTYDAEHLRAVHTALFADIYDWAGKTRIYPMAKDRIGFADPAQIGAYLRAAADHIATTDWGALAHGGLAVEAATAYAYLNTAHPWREGTAEVQNCFCGNCSGTTGTIWTSVESPGSSGTTARR
ncbi:Fic/DOC family protein [Gordonia sp. DT30]|uniref:Fic/DOC family protein n=1 Tax=unclassified Gordonia (in: high G+C Gram-positive bacteria) TaxID=2657482 RepID=UPI003CEBDED9